MTPKTHKTILIVNTVLCAIAIPISVGIQLMTVMGGAAAYEHAEVLAMLVVYLGLGSMAVPPLSIIVSWATMKWQRVSMTFVILPYAYALVLVICIALLFSTAG